MRKKSNQRLIVVQIFAARYQQDNSTDTREDTREVIPLLDKSLKHFEDGLCAFEAVRDNTNLALLYSNAGRLMRQRAYVNSKQSSQERNYYKKALDYYQKALQALGSRKSNEMIWNSVTWDLSTTLYTMATLLQDYPTVEQKVITFFFFKFFFFHHKHSFNEYFFFTVGRGNGA